MAIRCSIFITLFLFSIQTLVFALPREETDFNPTSTLDRQRGRFCRGPCIRGITLRRATRMCSRMASGCKAVPCVPLVGGQGYKCSFEVDPTPTPTATPTTTPTATPTSTPTVSPSPSPPLQFSGIELEDLVFPPDSTIGTKVELDVNVTVDITSGAPREDFYLLTDATGSMREEIAQTKSQFSSFIASREKSSGDVACGIGFYRDETDTPPFSNLQSITTDKSAVLSAISSLTATGGADKEEANLFALSEVATSDSIGWRIGSRKVLIYFGDAPGHEPTCPSPGTQLTRQIVSQQLNRKTIAIVATDFGGLDDSTRSTTNGDFSCGAQTTSPSGQATFIATATSGSIQKATSSPDLIQRVLESVESLDQVISVVTTDCAGRVDITFSPDLPIAIAAGETKTIMERAVLLPGACAFPDGFTCEIDLFLSGVGYKQVLQTTSISC